MDEEGDSYRWEKRQKQSWDDVKEDAEGNIIKPQTDRERSEKARSSRITQTIRRGLIRYMVLALDCSADAGEKDMMPSRLQHCKGALIDFINEFYEQNPISQITLVRTRDGEAQKVTDLSGNPKVHMKALGNIIETSGNASLQNVLVLALSLLEHIPDYGYKECLIVFSSISTCDPGNIFETIQAARQARLRVSVVCLSAEVHVARRLAEATGGTCTVLADKTGLPALVRQHCEPPVQARASAPKFTDQAYVGFPRQRKAHTVLAFEGQRVAASDKVFVCPRCHTPATDIPTECAVCRLQLHLSAHVARSHHHLFPVCHFVELPTENTPATKLATLASAVLTALGAAGTLEAKRCASACNGCLVGLEPAAMRLLCPLCECVFCVECDIFIHDTLHSCPGCGKAPLTAEVSSKFGIDEAGVGLSKAQ